MSSSVSSSSMLISVVVTTKNEEESIRELLNSLIVQEPPIEIIVVDAESSDSTQRIITEYIKKHDALKLYIEEGSRGKSMNFGVQKATGYAISFIGADDRAHRDWIRYVRIAMKEGRDVVVGKCMLEGKRGFIVDRVKLYHKGFDISYPGSNTTYKREIFNKLGGFDPDLITAEDMDLNYRAIEAGYEMHIEERAVVYRYARENVITFLKQAFWNGYGRKQLTLKHGKLWGGYSAKKTFQSHFTSRGLARLFFGLMGYLTCTITGGGLRK